jgi:hypothetical protein
MNERLFLAAILVTTTMVSSAIAQEHGPPAGGSDKNLKEAASDVKGRSIEMERIGREKKKPDSSRPAPSFAEIKEDFERIQIINNDVLQAGPSNATTDYERVSESAGEIGRRAIRLRSNLFAPDPGKHSKEIKSDTEDRELKQLLKLLDDSIASFTNSPIFKNTKVVTPKDSLTAQEELEKVIKLSGRIKNEADRLKKSVPK